MDQRNLGLVAFPAILFHILRLDLEYCGGAGRKSRSYLDIPDPLESPKFASTYELDDKEGESSPGGERDWRELKRT